MTDKLVQSARDLRKNSTEAEKLLWSRLRDRRLNGLKFKRQHPFPPYIVDFYCDEFALAIELDGGQHNDPATKKSDDERTARLQAHGLRVLCFWNNDVLTNIDGILQAIAENIPSPKSSPKGRGLPHLNEGAHDIPFPLEECRDLVFSPKRILIGEIATAHGIKGYVKLRSFADDETLLESDDVFIADAGGAKIKLTLKNRVGEAFVAEVEGVTDRNAAEALRGTKLYIDRAALPDTESGEYYFEDLKGLRVVDASGEDIGVVADVANYGAGDLLDIKPPSGENFYMPFTDDTVLGVDFDAGIIAAELPEII